MLCCVTDCIDPGICGIIHHHHLDGKCQVEREDENHCMLTICQRHKDKLTAKEGSIKLRYRTPRSTAVAMYYCDYPQGRYHVL
jgi:hypothetical protein